MTGLNGDSRHCSLQSPVSVWKLLLTETLASLAKSLVPVVVLPLLPKYWPTRNGSILHMPLVPRYYRTLQRKLHFVLQGHSLGRRSPVQWGGNFWLAPNEDCQFLSFSVSHASAGCFLTPLSLLALAMMSHRCLSTPDSRC